MNIFLSVLIAIVVVLLAGVLVAKFYNFFLKFRWLMLILALFYGTIIYAIGYWSPDYQFTAGTVFNVALQALFSAGRFFIFDTDIGLLANTLVLDTVWYNILFSLAGLFMMFAMATAAISIFGLSAIMKIKSFFANISNVYVFIGNDENALKLASDVKHRNKKATIFIIIDKHNTPNAKDLQKLCADNHIILCVSDFQLKDSKYIYLPKFLYNRIKSKKGNLSVLLLGKNVSENANFASDILSKSDIGGKSAVMYLQCDSLGLVRTFDTLNATCWQLRLFNYNQLIADILITKYPAIMNLPLQKDMYNVAKKPNIMLSGEGDLLREIALAVIRDTQFDGYLPDVTIYSRDAKLICGRLSQEAPELYKCADITYKVGDIGEENYYADIQQNKYDYIVIAGADKNENIKAGLLLAESCSEKPCLVYSNDFADYRLQEDGGYQGILLFGCDAEVVSYDTIIGGKLENTAIAVNKYYSNGADDYYSKGILEKKSNQAFGMNIPTKLQMLGMQLCSINDEAVLSGDKFRSLLGEKGIEELAMQEHARWNAFHFANGYRTWRIADIPSDYNKTKIDNPKRHACLVSYQELDEVSMRFEDKVKDIPQGYKGYDIMLVEKIPEILSYCNLGVKKL